MFPRVARPYCSQSHVLSKAPPGVIPVAPAFNDSSLLLMSHIRFGSPIQMKHTKTFFDPNLVSDA